MPTSFHALIEVESNGRFLSDKNRASKLPEVRSNKAMLVVEDVDCVSTVPCSVVLAEAAPMAREKSAD